MDKVQNAEMPTTTAFRFAAAEAWAITEEGLEKVLAICSRFNLDAALALEIQTQHAQRRAYTHEIVASVDGQDDAQAVSKGPMNRAEGRGKDLRRRQSVAVIPVYGTISRRASMFSSLSAVTSVDSIAEDFNAALEDKTFSSILFDFDSPGGTAKGISELAAMIYAARGKKPMCSYVNGDCASAAYWLAAATDRIVAGETSILGSIGVFTLAPGSKPGNYKLIRNARSPKKGLSLDSAEGQAEAQKIIDAMGDIFIRDVAMMRGVDEATVEEEFGQGSVLIGAEAVRVGMADSIGSFESVVETLAAGNLPERSQRAENSAGRKVMGSLKTNLVTYGRALLAGNKLELTPRAETIDDGHAIAAAIAAELQPDAAENIAVEQPSAAELKLRAELEAAQAEQRALTEKLEAEQRSKREAFYASTNSQVEAYVSGLLKTRAVPSETANLTALVAVAAFFDAGDFESAKAAMAEANCTELLPAVKAVLEARPLHGLTEQSVNASKHIVLPVEENPQASGEDTLTPERRAQLLGMSAVGKKVAAQATATSKQVNSTFN